MKTDRLYTVSQVSKLAGVSVKTLHHYDEKGILVPSRQQNNGYRVYSQSHLVQLQRILIYRELDFSLEEISSLLSLEDREVLDSLRNQKQMLIQRQQHLSKLVNSIEVAMDSIKGKENFDILFEDIPKEQTEQMTQELFSTEELEQGFVAFSKVSEQQMREFKQQSDAVTREFAQTIGQPVDSKLVQELTKDHYHMSNNFSKLVARANGIEDPIDIGYEDYLVMANSVDNQEMQELCKRYGDGYAEHARQAMIHYAELHLKKA